MGPRISLHPSSALLQADGNEATAEDVPLPLPYAVQDGGKCTPLPGVFSLFLTSTTLDIIGVAPVFTDPLKVLMAYVSRDKLAHDIQFRGAISDFHPIKNAVLGADYDPLMLRTNPDDIYGDGNNFELATQRKAAETWEFIEAELERRLQAGAQASTAVQAAKAQPPSKKEWVARPWQSLGSEVDMEEESEGQSRPGLLVLARRARQHFRRPCVLADKDSAELWNSSQAGGQYFMEVRPFRDSNYDLRRVEQDIAVQAVVVVQDTGVQATGGQPRHNAAQYQARQFSEQVKQQLLDAPGMADFLQSACSSCKDALQQNEVTNIFEDDFAALGDEEASSGSRRENSITEYQSFVDLTFSKNKVVSAIQWLPHRKGMVAVACTEPLSFSERVEVAGTPKAHAVLIWNFKDPIHPEMVLESPFEVFSFQCNPAQPDAVAGGCHNGQVILWDVSAEEQPCNCCRVFPTGASAPAGSTSGSVAAGKPHSLPPSNRVGASCSAPFLTAAEFGQTADRAAIPVVRHQHLSLVDASHHSSVTDLQWLPGMAITGKGRPPTAKGRAMRECNFFATTAADGKVLFWDMRVGRGKRKVKREGDDEEVEWRPTFAVTLLSLEGAELACMRLCINIKGAAQSTFFVSSFDGELVYADWMRPEGEEHPEHCKSISKAHAGAVVTLQRSPFFDDILLSTGDWSWALWQEGRHDICLFQSLLAAAQYTAGCWSPTRPGVLYLGRADGVLEVWDLLDRSHEPSMTANPTSSAITSLSFSPAGAPAAPGGRAVQQLLAVGDSTGVLHVMDLPRTLRRRVINEVKTVTTFMQREQQRLGYLASRKPIRAEAAKVQAEAQKAAEQKREAEAAQAAAAAAASATGAPLITSDSMNCSTLQEVDEMAEQAYRKMEQAFREQLGLAAQAPAAAVR
eukprot:jgi/Astpho2/1605/e_gw1.00028.2.1_t